MTTIVTTVKNAIAPAGAPVIQLPTPEETALLQSENLQAWWRPDSNYAANDHWVDKKNSNALQRNDTQGWPVTAVGINAQTYMQRNTGGTFVSLKPTPESTVKFPVPPKRGYTFAWVGVPTLFDRPAICAIFSPHADGNSNVGYVGYGQSARTILVRNRLTSFITYTIPDPEIEHSVVVSFDYEDNSAVLFIDGEQIMTATNANLPFSDGLSVFAPMTPAGTPLTAGSFVGRIYDLMVYDDALHQSRNVTQLAALNSYLLGRYGL